MPAGMGRHSHPHPHMPGGPVDLGECVLIYIKILEAGGGAWAHDSMHAHKRGKTAACQQGAMEACTSE